jgi:hypothetical protein
MFPEARSHRLEVVPRPVVIPAPDDTAARSMWQALIDLANLCRDAHARDHTDRAREVVGSALRELRQALGDRTPVSDIVDLEEAAAICRMSPKTLQNRMTEDKGCPRLPGKHPTFDRSTLLEWRKNLPARKRKKKTKRPAPPLN